MTLLSHCRPRVLSEFRRSHQYWRSYVSPPGVIDLGEVVLRDRLY